jgi:hypothetical protein
MIVIALVGAIVAIVVEYAFQRCERDWDDQP